MTIWTIKSEAAYRIKLRHPWVYRDELSRAPILPHDGAAVELQNDKGDVLARGYGNLRSKLAFRALSFGLESGHPASEEFVLYKVLNAWKAKRNLGFTASLRVCFGEGDGLPGLVMDFYQLAEELKGQALVLQVLTAGIDSILRKNPNLIKNLIDRAYEQKLCPQNWDRTAVIFRNDVRVRELEGLRKEEPRFVQTIKEINWSDVPVVLNSYDWKKQITLNCDLYQGQKTGLFLDQSYNIASVLQFLSLQKLPQKIRVLDICCYVGHWSAQIAQWAKDHNKEVIIDQMDISADALVFAQKNAAQASQVQAIKQDALEDWTLENQAYDLVICDPPAFVKSAKDVDRGVSAYIRLNSEAVKRVKKSGYLVACSCSGLVTREIFDQALQKSFVRANAFGHLLLKGGSGWDHTARPEFPEGQYLKMNTYQIR